jgi:hypothetical protein
MGPLDPGRGELEARELSEGITAIVFAGMCIEAALFDLTAITLGNEFAEQIGKLDSVAKLAVLVRVLGGETLDKGSLPCQMLKKLIQARNKLVHYKSKPWPGGPFEELIARAIKASKRFVSDIEDSYRAVVLFSLQLDSSLGGTGGVIRSFKHASSWKNSVPTILHPCIIDCVKKFERIEQKIA